METKKVWNEKIIKLQTTDKKANKNFQEVLKIIGKTITKDFLHTNKLIKIDEEMEWELEQLRTVMDNENYITLMVEIHAIMMWLKKTSIDNEEYEVAENLTRLGI